MQALEASDKIICPGTWKRKFEDEMAYTGNFLRQIKWSLGGITSPYASVARSRQLICCFRVEKKAWVKGLENFLCSHSSASSRIQCKLDKQRNWVGNLCFSGRRLNLGSILGVSVIIGSFNYSPKVAYAMDEDDYHVDMPGASDVEEDQKAMRAFVRKLWLPVLFFFTVLASWDHPMALASQVIIFLLSTKPSPLSVYVFVEQLCHQCMRRDPHLYGSKSLYASKVEVEDYKILCLAHVVISNRRFALVGILGGWWTLPSSSELFSSLRNSSSFIGGKAYLDRYSVESCLH